MKPQELLAMRRRRGKPGQAQMRDRNAAPPPAAPPPRDYPARNPKFPGETREQELKRLRAAAPVARPAPPPLPNVPPPQQLPAAPPEDAITLCACPSHECAHVATLRALWPDANGGPIPGMLDVCERCAAAIKADPVGQLVTGLQFAPLQAPMHAELEDEDAEDEDAEDLADPKWGPHESPEAAAAAQAPPSGKVTP